MTRYLTIGLLALLVIYGTIEAWPLMRGPRLTVDSPADHASIEGGIVTVSGRAERVARFTLNGAPLLHDQTGTFSSTLTFPRGGTILTFMAADRFGRTITLTRSIFVTADAAVGSPTSDVGAN